MLIATVPYVGKRLHLDPDPELNYGSEHANNFWSIRIRIHNPAYWAWTKIGPVCLDPWDKDLGRPVTQRAKHTWNGIYS